MEKHFKMINTDQINLKAKDQVKNDPIAQNYNKVRWTINAMLWLKITVLINCQYKHPVWKNISK